MPETSPAQEPDDLPTLFSLPGLSIGSHGVIDTGLTVVTEDGRRLRITGARYLDGGVHLAAEITVAEEDA
jgi:hypothetical protein